MRASDSGNSGMAGALKLSCNSGRLQIKRLDALGSQAKHFDTFVS